MQRSGADAIAGALAALGVDVVFSVPSAHNLPLLAALGERGIDRIGCRHEQGAAHAADGFARTRGSLGVVVASGGPGTANTMGGLYEAHYASSPVLLLTSQVETSHLGRGRGYVHEAEDQAAMLHTVCREVATARPAEDLGATLLRLARVALTGRPRPVALEVPLDLWSAHAESLDDIELLVRASRPLPVVHPTEDALARAVDVLACARRPVVWAGGGVIRSGAADELLALAERWDAPVLTSREGRGAIPEHHPRSLGPLAALAPLSRWLRDCDVMLAVGTRFQMYPTDLWRLPVPPRLVHLDADPTVPGRSYPAEVALTADAAVGLRALTERLPRLAEEAAVERKRHLHSGLQAREAARAVVAEQCGPDHWQLSQVLGERLPPTGVLVSDPTVPATVWGDRVVPIHRQRTSIRSVAAGIGPGMALALGAAIASGQHAVLLAGDGGFVLGLAELATAVQSGAKVVVCLFDDHGYGMLRDIAGAHDPQFDLVAPDFHDLALLFGARAARVASASDFDRALSAALDHNGPTLIHVDLTALAPLDRSAGTSPQPLDHSYTSETEKEPR